MHPVCRSAHSLTCPHLFALLPWPHTSLFTKSLFLAVFIRRPAGEILPQAVCSRYGLTIGGMAAPVVRFLMWFTAPISWPIGKALDAILGHEQPTFGKRQISALVDLHRWVGDRPGCAVPVQLGQFWVEELYHQRRRNAISSGAGSFRAKLGTIRLGRSTCSGCLSADY